jgi:hypothetical protein
MKRWFYDYNILILLANWLKWTNVSNSFQQKRSTKKNDCWKKSSAYIVVEILFPTLFLITVFCKTILVTNLYSSNCPTFITSWLKWPTVADSSQIYSFECEIHYLVFKLDIDIECLILERNPQKSHIKNSYSTIIVMLLNYNKQIKIRCYCITFEIKNLLSGNRNKSFWRLEKILSLL